MIPFTKGKKENRKGPHYSKRRLLISVLAFIAMLRQAESQTYLTLWLEQETNI